MFIAIKKKHATACHVKLETFLEEQHEFVKVFFLLIYIIYMPLYSAYFDISFFSNLQKKLKELNDYKSYSDEWLQLTSKIDIERSSRNRREVTKKLYESFLNFSKCSVYFQVVVQV